MYSTPKSCIKSVFLFSPSHLIVLRSCNPRVRRWGWGELRVQIWLESETWHSLTIDSNGEPSNLGFCKENRTDWQQDWLKPREEFGWTSVLERGELGHTKRRAQKKALKTFENFSKTLKSRVQEDFEDDGRLQARFGRTAAHSETPRGTCVPSPTEWLSKGHKQQPQSSVQIAAALQQCADKATWLWTQGFLLQHLLLLLLLHEEQLRLQVLRLRHLCQCWEPSKKGMVSKGASRRDLQLFLGTTRCTFIQIIDISVVPCHTFPWKYFQRINQS